MRPQAHLLGIGMSRLVSITSPSGVNCAALRLSVALSILLVIGLSSASSVRAQSVARSEEVGSTRVAWPVWSPNRPPPPPNESGRSATENEDNAVLDSQTASPFRPPTRVAQVSQMVEASAAEAFDEKTEEVPLPEPDQNAPARIDGGQFTDHEPFVGEGLSGPCGDNECANGEYWYNPYFCAAGFERYRLFGGRFWGRSEYLLWWTSGSHLPALVTTSPVGTLPEDSGILGRSDTTVLYGDNRVTTDARSGGRFTIGYLLSDCDGLGVEANYLFLGRAADHYRADYAAIPILARPYYDLGIGAEDSMLISHPDFLNGSVFVDTKTDFQGAELLLRKTMWQGYSDRFDVLLGYRFTRLDDGLTVHQSSLWTQTQGLIEEGTTKDLFDSFDTENQFHGGELGLSYRDRMGQWSVEVLGKVALGNTSSQVRVDGATVTTTPDGSSATFSGGLLAQDTNIGLHRQNEFSVIPEFGVTLGYNLTRRLRASFGYTFIYWNNVLRAGDQVDRAVSQLPPEPPTGDQRPGVLMKNTDFWSQGMRFGLDYCF